MPVCMHVCTCACWSILGTNLSRSSSPSGSFSTCFHTVHARSSGSVNFDRRDIANSAPTNLRVDNPTNKQTNQQTNKINQSINHWQSINQSMNIILGRTITTYSDTHLNISRCSGEEARGLMMRFSLFKPTPLTLFGFSMNSAGSPAIRSPHASVSVSRNAPPTSMEPSPASATFHS